MRTGQYGGGEEQEMLTYGPESYVPGDRYINVTHLPYECPLCTRGQVIYDMFCGEEKTAEYGNIQRNHILLCCRYDELGEGRASASNSDQTGTLSRYQ